MKGRILLVDDNEDFLDSTKDVLEEEGYEVVTAATGEEAVQKVERQFFHVVVMDIKMPGINGVEAFVRMKRVRPTLKAIMCTAYIVENLIREAFQEGAYAVLNKPFEMDLLLRTIDEARLQGGFSGLILLADADGELRDRLDQLLTAIGHRVVVAGDGMEALDRGRRHRFDILLLGWDLSGMNGLEVHHRLKGGQPDLLATIIMGPDAADDGAAMEAMRSEMRLTGLTKPVDVHRLMELVESICAARRL